MKKLFKVLVIFGTRPEAIKIAPVIKELQKHADKIETIVLTTGQHREMVDQVLEIFQIKPDYDLNLMTAGQTLPEITARILLTVDTVLKKEKPDFVFVHGDTVSAQASSLVAFYHQIPVGHVEAGLRTHQKYDPFPEEVNREIIDSIASMHFAPTKGARDNLLAEGKGPATITLTGNTGIDALHWVLRKDIPFEEPALSKPDFDNSKILLVTTHRRENFGEPLVQIHTAIKEVVLAHPDVEVVFPVHPNPNVTVIAQQILGNVARVHLVPPLSYPDLVMLLKRVFLVATDSGGLQEEAASLGIPVLVLRRSTERPEGIDAGTAKLVGVEKKDIIREIKSLLQNETKYKTTRTHSHLYGDGQASGRIVEELLKKYVK